MDLLVVLQFIGRGAGLLAAGVTGYRALRHRDARRLEIFLAVASFALPLWLGSLLPILKTVLYAANVILLARLVRYLRDVSRWVLFGGVLVFVLDLVVYPGFMQAPRPLTSLTSILAAVLLVYVTAALLTEARRRTGVTRRRLGFAALAVAAQVVPELGEITWLGTGAETGYRLNDAMHSTTLLGLYLAFATPYALLRRWQWIEEARYLNAASARDVDARGRAAADDLARGAAGVAGNTAVVVALRDPSRLEEPLAVRAATVPSLVDVTVDPSGGAIDRVMSSGQPMERRVTDCEPPLSERLATLGHTVLIAPVASSDLTWGVVIAVQRRASLFPEDDPRLLAQLAKHAATGLDHARLATEERDRARRAAERRLREVESRVSLMLESIKDYALFVMDDRGRVVGWQPGAEHVFGFTDEEMRDRPAAPLFNLTADELRVRLDEARARGAVEYEGACRRKDATAFTGQTLIRPLVSDDDAVGGFVAVTRDVTERRLLEDRLHHSEKLEAVGVLAGGVAHDFNNLLAAIIGYAGLVQMTLTREDPNHEHIEEIQVVAEKAAVLTQQLLAFSRRQTLRSAVVDLGALVDELLPILRSLVGAAIEIVHERSAVWPIAADPSQLDRVLVNLATNARDAMPGGGTLTLRTANVVLDEPVNDLPPGSFVQLQVSDTGIGMDEATQARVFEPFFSTREFGRGLGLSAVYGIVRQMNGGITVQSAPQKGATFTLYFPQTAAPAAVSTGTSGAAVLEAGASLLLVEDDVSVRSFLRQVLEREGYRVLAAEHKASALQLVAGSNEPIALIITDLVMPGGGGTGLVEAVERIRPGVPALYISGHIDPTTAPDQASPPMHFLQKPFSSDQLLTRVREILTLPS